MAHYVYSVEPLPAEHLIGKPGYTPECLKWAGIELTIPAGEWVKLPDYYPMLRHHGWTDKSGTRERVYTTDIVEALRNKAAQRGIIFIDHEPSAAEKVELEKASAELNLKHRAECVRFYEEQVREKEVTGFGRTKPTPYEDECYTLLGLTKPYSPEALRAQRHPGEDAADRIATAITNALSAAKADSTPPATEVK
jgi:hypothetical protein